MPAGATKLASSVHCANQAWCMGPHLAMQFHIEIDAAKAEAWTQDEDPQWAAAIQRYDSVQDAQSIRLDTAKHLAQHQDTADHIYTTWLAPTVWATRNQQTA